MNQSRKIAFNFYQSTDVVGLARKMIGLRIISNINGQLVSGIISETEAYCGLSDRACHAYLNKHTQRTHIFYQPGGLAYVYLCYGIHNLFNIIVGPKDDPKAILIRSVIPETGIKTMQTRRKFATDRMKNLTNGPGKFSQAFGIDKQHNGLLLYESSNLWLEHTKLSYKVQVTPRIGIDYAGEDALLPWRFVASNTN